MMSAIRELKPIYSSCESFYGRALVLDLAPGIELLESLGRPTAVWIEALGKIYLLLGWDATQNNLRHVREFVSQKTGLKDLDTDALRQAAREGDGLVDCSFLNLISFEEITDLYKLPKLYNRIKDRLDQTQAHESSEGADDSEPDSELENRVEPPAPPKPRLRSSIPLTTVIEEWINDIDDPKSNEMALARLNSVQVNKLLIEAGYLGQDKAPTQKGEEIGLKTSTWHDGLSDESPYALYPRRRAGEYRQLIYRLYRQKRQTGAVIDNLEA